MLASAFLLLGFTMEKRRLRFFFFWCVGSDTGRIALALAVLQYDTQAPFSSQKKGNVGEKGREAVIMSGDRVFVGLETSFSLDLPATMDRVRARMYPLQVPGFCGVGGSLEHAQMAF